MQLTCPKTIQEYSTSPSLIVTSELVGISSNHQVNIVVSVLNISMNFHLMIQVYVVILADYEICNNIF